MSSTVTTLRVERTGPGVFVSASGRTAFASDHAGLERIAEEHEWMRDRIARLELDNALLRSVVELSGLNARASAQG